MEQKTFDQFLLENTLNPGMVCQSKDKLGDLAGKTIFIKKKTKNELEIVLDDGTEATTTVAAISIDPKSIRPYDPNKDSKKFSKYK
jgi:hypothetical protein